MASSAGFTIIKHQDKKPEVKDASTVTAVDTSSWVLYQDPSYGFSFLHDPAWTVKPEADKGDYKLIEIDPGKQFFNIDIYISQKDYYIMDGLPVVDTDINGKSFKNVSNMLFGTFNAPYYFTFDLGKSASLLPSFYALVHTLKF
jgi:hypothetical protein